MPAWHLATFQSDATPPLGHPLCGGWIEPVRGVDDPLRALGAALVLHLPGEPFVEYQLKAQQLRKDVFVCVAGYGDGGPGYIPTDRAYLEGGYEPTVALARPSEKLLTKAIGKALQAKKD